MSIVQQPTNLTQVLQIAIDNALTRISTCMPGRVVSYDYATKAAEVQPLINRLWSDGSSSPMPIITDVPVVWPCTAGASLTMPINAGDGVLLLFADRSLDLWLSKGGQVTPDDGRKHDLADCIAIPGLWPFTVQSLAENNDDVLLTYAGSKIRLTKAGNVEIETGGDVIATAGGNIEATATGDITADATGKIEAKAGTTAKIEATTSAQLKAGTTIALGTATEELLQLISETITAVVSFAPSPAKETLQAIGARLASIKGVIT